MTTWGAWSSDNRLKAGLDLSISPTSVGTGTASVTVYWTLRGQSRYASYESGTGITDWAISGSKVASGSMNGWNVGAMGTWVVASGSFTVNTSYTSAVTVTINGNYTSGGAYPGTKPTVSASISVPRRPYSTPAAPTSPGLVRGSGESLSCSWTRNVSTGAPYSSQQIQFYNSIDNTWYVTTTLSSTATSYNTTGGTNKRYQFRVRGYNADGGYSAWATSGSVSTTPSAPAAPVATKTSGGDISLALTAPASNTSANTVEIWHAANGVWDGAALATVSRATTSYTHLSPNTSQTHTYRVRAVSTGPTLYSAYSADSNTVQLLAPPNAPTSLSPASGALDAGNDIVFTWQHNPVDTTPQTKYEFQYRLNGGAWVNSGTVTSSASTRTITGGTIANGNTVEWQVRTYGSHASASPWSAIATFTTSTPPTVALVTPDTSGAWAFSDMTVEWTYGDAESSPQANYRVTLYDTDGVTPLETRNLAGASSSLLLQTRLRDGRAYSVGVSVQDSTGLWSAEAKQAFTVSYAKPPAPTLTTEWDPDGGTVAVTYENTAPGPDRTNLLVNPDFEVDAANWTAGGGRLDLASVEDPRPVFGRRILRATANVDNAANNAYLTAATGTGTFAPGDNVTMSAYVRHSGPVDRQFRIMGRWLDAASAILSTSYGTTYTVPPNEWVRIDLTMLAAPASTSRAGAYFYQFSPDLPVGDYFDVDAAMLEKSATLNQFIVGTVSETDADTVEIWRRFGGSSWALVASGLPTNSTVTDYIPPLSEDVEYKGVSVSALPSSSDSQPYLVQTDGAKHVFLNAGPDFSTRIRLRSNVDTSMKVGRARRSRRAAGRVLPGAHDGSQRFREVSVAALLWNPRWLPDRAATASTWKDIQDFAYMPSPACYRDLDGERIFVTVGTPSISNYNEHARAVSIDLEENDFTETVEVDQ